MTLIIPDWLIAVTAALTAIIGVARLTRVVVYDDFPPATWLRMMWDRLVDPDRGPWWKLWNKLLHCWWCASFWVALLCIGWWMLGALLPWVIWTWWVFWGALAVGYIATMVIVRDDPSDDDDSE